MVCIVILVGLASFELGRLSKGNEGSEVKVGYGDQASSAILSTESVNPVNKIIPNLSTKAYFASSKGTKYYSIGCSGGKNIKQENRVWFATGEEAQKAGYVLSGSCK